MIQRALLLALPILLLAAAPSKAESGFDKFKRRVDSIRPRGTLLRKVFGTKEEDATSEDSAKEKAPRNNNPQQPTPADPQTRPELRPRNTNRLSPQGSGSPTLAVPRAQAANPTSTQRGNYNLTEKQKPSTSGYRRPQPTAASDSSRSAPKAPARNKAPAKPAVQLGTTTRSSSKGLQVTNVAKGSVAAEAGILSGDLLLEIAGLKISSEEDITGLLEALNSGDQVEAIVQRGAGKKTLLLQFGEPANKDSEASTDTRSQQPDLAPANNPTMPRISPAYTSQQQLLKAAAPRAAIPQASGVPKQPSDNQTNSRNLTPQNVEPQVEALRAQVRDQQRTIQDLQRRLLSTQRSSYRGR